jgi:hypothetical protein
MKKILLLLGFVAVSVMAYTQSCSKMFISKYVEGYTNNRAVEIYNPTSQAIDLSAYTIGRFSNGSINYQPQVLPSVMLQPYDTYLAVIDKRDSLGTCFEIPVWNGYQKWDVCIDGTTGMPIIDTDGDTVYCVQYGLVTCSGGADIPHHLYQTEYNDFLDLAGKADGFFNPVYISGSTPMYFNGNDAVALVEGSNILPDASNILDVVGVIGEDPGEAWSTWSGYFITKDRTLVKRPQVEAGNIPIATTPNDTLAYAEWDIYPKNTFHVVDGGHECSCDPNYVSTKQINLVDFKIYPNPADNGHVMIEAEAPIQDVIVSNIVGQTIANFNLNSQNVREELSIPNLDTGLYLITIRFKDNSVTTRKLMVK